MKKLLATLMAILVVMLSVQQTVVAQVTPPAGWGDFQMGLVNDNSNIINVRMKKALSESVKLHYRYAYVNNGVDPNSNALSWLFNQWGTDYSKNSADMGLRPGYVIYMLQEEGGATALKNNIQNAAFMRNYFTSIRIVSEKSNGYKSIFVIEPDTWGYFLQDALQQGTQSDPRLIPATVNNLGAGYEYLNDLPNTLSGVAFATIRTIRRYAPDAYCGLLMSFWSVAANGATGPPVADGAKGMVYWNQSDVDYSARRNADFAIQLLGTTGDRGDFIGVEKNGWSAGNWLVKQNRNDYYWNDTQNAKWVSWSKTLRENVNLPLLGWQISIGHIGLPNTVNRYEDTFMPYFFSHVPEFINAGFIGFLAGKGLADCTDFTNLNGNELESNGSAGDDGWFFEKLKTFDSGRPYLGGSAGPTVSITSPLQNATFAAGTTITLSANATGGTGCTATKVEFFRGTTKICEDLTAPYSCSWAGATAGTYTLTARVTNSCAATVTSSAVTITVTGPTLPAPWQNADIGTVSPAGSATHSTGTYTVKGAGADIWGTVDAFQYVYQPVNGNVEIIARVASLTNTNAWAKAGVMIRETLAANSKHAMVAATPSNGVALQSRSATGGTSVSVGTMTTIPVWVKLNRSGNTFTASRSTDGVTWTTIGTVTITMTTSVYVGLAVTSHANGTLTTAAITNVSVSGVNSLPSATITSPANGATFTAPASVTINANASDSDGSVSKVEFYQGTTKLGEDVGAPYSFNWTNVVAGNYSLTAKAIDNAGASGTSSVVNIIVSGNTPPTVSITLPTNGASYAAPANITINANASDPGGSVSKVEFFNGTTKLGEDISSPYAFAWNNVPAGSYSLTAKATDNLGLTATSSPINITVGSNIAPTASITSPANGSSFAAPATITINASASDSDGSVSKVEFFNGASKLGEDATSPYSFTWTGVSAGTYSFTVKSTDNLGLTGPSSAAVSVTVTTGGCSYPQYVENGGYVAGSIVKNGGNSYECKPYPYSGWCNGGAWAYAPGTGAYWQDAWILKGACAGRTREQEEQFAEATISSDADGLAMYPNPGKSNESQTITLTFEKAPRQIKVYLQDVSGMEAFSVQQTNIKTNNVNVKIPALPHGLYIMQIHSEHKLWIRKYLIRE